MPGQSIISNHLPEQPSNDYALTPLRDFLVCVLRLDKYIIKDYICNNN